MSAPCEICGAGIDHLRAHARFCGSTCRGMAWRGEVYLPPGRCGACGEQLQSFRAKFCSDACRSRAWRARRAPPERFKTVSAGSGGDSMQDTVCGVCARQGCPHLRREKSKYCSARCAQNAQQDACRERKAAEVQAWVGATCTRCAKRLARPHVEQLRAEGCALSEALCFQCTPPDSSSGEQRLIESLDGPLADTTKIRGHGLWLGIKLDRKAAWALLSKAGTVARATEALDRFHTAALRRARAEPELAPVVRLFVDNTARAEERLAA